MRKYMMLIPGLLLMILSLSFISYKTSMVRLPKEIKKSFAFVPMGVLSLDSTKYTVQAFFISKYEVSNLQYRTFLDDLKNRHEMEKLEIAAIDSNQWLSDVMYCEPLVIHYHSHPAYNNYPVVNISYEAALLYCEWLSKKINKEQDGDYVFYCRLPQRKEWIRAANGTIHHGIFSWGGPSMRNEKGGFQCNFKNIGDENIRYNEEKKLYEVLQGSSTLYEIGFSSNYLTTAPVESFTKNSLGLFNMNGNVAEMVQEKGIAAGGSWNSPGFDVRNQSVIEYTTQSPTVGFRPVISFNKK